MLTADTAYNDTYPVYIQLVRDVHVDLITEEIIELIRDWRRTLSYWSQLSRSVIRLIKPAPSSVNVCQTPIHLTDYG